MTDNTPTGEVKRINVAVNPETVEMLAHMIDRDQVSLTEAARVLMGVGDAITRLAKDDGRRILAMDTDGDTTEVVVMTNPGDGIREYEPSEFVLDGVTLHEGRCSACVWWAPTKDPALTRAEFDAHVCTEYPARTPSELPVAPNLGAGDSPTPSLRQVAPTLGVEEVDPDREWVTTAFLMGALKEPVTRESARNAVRAMSVAGLLAALPAGSVVPTDSPTDRAWQPNVGDKVSYAGEDEVCSGKVVRLGEPRHREALVQGDRWQDGEPQWFLFEDLQPAVSSSDGEVATPLADLPHEEWRGFHTAATGTDPGPAPAQPGEDTTPCNHAPFDFCLCNPMTEFQRKAAQAQKLGYCEAYVRASADPEEGEGCPELRVPGSIHCEGHGGTTP